MVEVDGDWGLWVDHRRIDHDPPGLVDADAPDTDQALGQHALVARAPRQRRDERQVRHGRQHSSRPPPGRGRAGCRCRSHPAGRRTSTSPASPSSPAPPWGPPRWPARTSLGKSAGVDGRAGVVVWVLRAGWLVLPLTVGPAVGQALDGRRTSLEVTALVLLWAAWAVGSGGHARTVDAEPDHGAAAGAARRRGGGAGRAVRAPRRGARRWPSWSRWWSPWSRCRPRSAWPSCRPRPTATSAATRCGLPVAAAGRAGPAGLGADGRADRGRPAAARRGPAALVAVVSSWSWAAFAAVLARRLHRLTRRWVVLVPAGLRRARPARPGRHRDVPPVPGRPRSGSRRPGTEATDLTGRAAGPAARGAPARARPRSSWPARCRPGRHGPSTVQLVPGRPEPARPGARPRPAAGGYPVG